MAKTKVGKVEMMELRLSRLEAIAARGVTTGDSFGALEERLAKLEGKAKPSTCGTCDGKGFTYREGRPVGCKECFERRRQMTRQVNIATYENGPVTLTISGPQGAGKGILARLIYEWAEKKFRTSYVEGGHPVPERVRLRIETKDT